MTTFEEYWKEHGSGFPEQRHEAKKVWTACFRSFSSFLEGGKQAKIELEYILGYVGNDEEVDAYIRTVLPNIKKLMGDTL